MLRLIATLLWLGLFSSVALAHPPEMCEGVPLGNGFFSLGNILIFVGALIICIALLLLFLYFELPALLLRWLFLAVGIMSVVIGDGAPLGLPSGFWAFTGALGIGGFLYWKVIDGDHDMRWVYSKIVSAVAALAWGYIAISYDVAVVGFMATAAVGYMIASTKAVDLLASPLGISDVSYSGSTTLAGLVILLGYLLGQSYGWPVSVFEFGAYYISGLVFSASLLISTWSGLSKTWLGWIWHEAIFLGVAFLGILYGSEIGATELVQMGGTLLVIWVMLKVGELVVNFFLHSPLIAIILVLGVGIFIAWASVSLMDNATLLRAYTFLP